MPAAPPSRNTLRITTYETADSLTLGNENVLGVGFTGPTGAFGLQGPTGPQGAPSLTRSFAIFLNSITLVAPNAFITPSGTLMTESGAQGVMSHSGRFVRFTVFLQTIAIPAVTYSLHINGVSMASMTISNVGINAIDINVPFVAGNLYSVNATSIIDSPRSEVTLHYE